MLLAADVIYFEEQDPLVQALDELMSSETLLLLAYKERTVADRQYLEEVILPHLEVERMDYRSERGVCEIYMGRRGKRQQISGGEPCWIEVPVRCLL